MAAGSELYRAWLRSQERDAAVYGALADAGISSASWLVTDHYGPIPPGNPSCSCPGRGQCPSRLFVIDDLADRPTRRICY